jgi:hypothetical protein
MSVSKKELDRRLAAAKDDNFVGGATVCVPPFAKGAKDGAPELLWMG